MTADHSLAASRWTSTPSHAPTLLDGLVDDLILDIIFEEHHSAKTAHWPHSEGTGADIFGNSGTVVAGSSSSGGAGAGGAGPAATGMGTATDGKPADSTFKCEHCRRVVSVMKYAPHLEKCMGKGRGARRRAVDYTERKKDSK